MTDGLLTGYAAFENQQNQYIQKTIVAVSMKDEPNNC